MTPLALLLLSSGPAWVYPGASLDMDFAGNRYFLSTGSTDLSSLLSTTRASTELEEWSDWHYSSFGNNASPITDLGIWPWQASTNLVLQSNSPNTTWTQGNTVSVNGAATGPDNVAAGAGSIADNSTSGQHSIQQTPASFTSATTYVLSGFFQAGTATVVQLTFGGGAFSGAGFANFNLANGTVGTTGGTLVGSGIAVASNGWYRCWIIATATATAATPVIINLTNNSTSAVRNVSYVGTGQTLNIWGAQLEALAFPTSPILTTTAAVTRAFGNISPIGAALNALKSPSGTIIISLNSGLASQTGTILGLNALIGLGKTSGNALTTAFGGAQTTGNTATWTGPVKVGLRWTPTAVSIVLNGGTIATAANVPPPVTSAFIGSTSGSSAAVNQPIKRITVLPFAVSDAVFQSLST